ncbi:MAG TPA: hypothetical protein VJW96_03130 [Terriglobales bacterium]|jgi:hypothetical protein|nr:hypothetical protein [Terriglobales bacterium]
MITSSASNNSKVVLLADQHTFHPRQRSSFDADPLPDDKVGMGLDLSLSETGAERFDFKIGERREVSSKTDQRQHARHLEHAHAVPGIDAHKHVVWKERQLEVHLAAVSPTVARRIQRQKGLNLTLAKLPSYAFFMMGIGVGCKPVRRTFLGYRQSIHLLFSFVLSSC